MVKEERRMERAVAESKEEEEEEEEEDEGERAEHGSKKRATKSHETAKVKLEWQTGVSTSDWESIASSENVKAISNALESLESEVSQVHESMLELRKREEEMREMNESTNSKVAWLSFVSLAVCFSLTAWQLFHLKAFFERKKVL